MVSLNDYKIQLRAEENEYEATERFGEEEGFALAAGVVSTNSDDWDDEAGRYLHKEIPPEIGSLKFYVKRFGQGFDMYWDEIDSRQCTDDDFDYNKDESNPKSRFFKTVTTYADVKEFGLYLNCAKTKEDFYTFGNYDVAEAGNLQVVFELCDAEKNAKS